jgi:hypothetical protein
MCYGCCFYTPKHGLSCSINIRHDYLGKTCADGTNLIYIRINNILNNNIKVL